VRRSEHCSVWMEWLLGLPIPGEVTPSPPTLLEHALLTVGVDNTGGGCLKYTSYSIRSRPQHQNVTR